MQHREIKNRIECFVVEREARDVSFYNSYSISKLCKSIASSLDHLGIEVDRGNPIRTKLLDLASNAFTGSTANVEDFEALGTSAKRDELWDHASPQSLGSQAAVDVNGLGPIHPHPRNSRTSACLRPGVRGHPGSPLKLHLSPDPGLCTKRAPPPSDTISSDSMNQPPGRRPAAKAVRGPSRRGDPVTS